MKILLVDDEPDYLNTLTRYLTKKGYEVETATNGQHGWDVFSQSPYLFDVILTDVKMPLLDGVGFLKRVRQKGHSIPAIIMAGHTDYEDTSEIGDLELFDILRKPFKLKALLSLLSQLENA